MSSSRVKGLNTQAGRLKYNTKVIAFPRRTLPSLLAQCIVFMALPVYLK